MCYSKMLYKTVLEVYENLLCLVDKLIDSQLNVRLIPNIEEDGPFLLRSPVWSPVLIA